MHIKGIVFLLLIHCCSVLFIFSSLVHKVLIISSLISQKKHDNLLNWLKEEKEKADQSGIVS